MITSVQNDQVKTWAKVQQKKYRDAQGICLVEGEHLVDLALQHTEVIVILTLTPSTKYKDAVQVSEHVMKKITEHTMQVAAIVKKPALKGEGERIVLLDRVQDPGNVGTLMRSALAFGFDRMVLYQSADPFSPKVLRATQGAIFELPIEILDEPTNLKVSFSNHAFIAAVLNGQKPHRIEGPFVLMLGNEGQGLNDAFLALKDHSMTIQTSSVESLNVAVAGSILMHQLVQG